MTSGAFQWEQDMGVQHLMRVEGVFDGSERGYFGSRSIEMQEVFLCGTDPVLS